MVKPEYGLVPFPGYMGSGNGTIVMPVSFPGYMGSGNGTIVMSGLIPRLQGKWEWDYSNVWSHSQAMLLRSVVVYLHGVLVVLQGHLTKTVLPYHLLVPIVNEHHLRQERDTMVSVATCGGGHQIG